MNTNTLPLILDPQLLEQQLQTDKLCIVDLCKPETRLNGHVPGAIYLEYNSIINSKPPVMGLLPDEAGLASIAASIGLTPETRVVAYDDEGGGKAARLLWTLEIMGHKHLSLLDGGIHAWSNEGHELEDSINQATKTDYPVKLNESPVAERDFILEHLNDDSVVMLDTRSPAEFDGTKKYAQRGGHIPGAINIDWVEAMDQDKNLRAKPETEIRDLLKTSGVTPDKTIVAYCHTNHRSAYIYFVLKALEYPNIKAYPGSWSDWGNASDTPIEP